MRFLILTLLVAACAFAPVAAAQTAGPSVPAPRPAASTASALDGDFKGSAPRQKRVHRTPRKRVARHTVRKPHAARPLTRTRAVPPRAPARHTATPGPEVALLV